MGIYAVLIDWPAGWRVLKVYGYRLVVIEVPMDDRTLYGGQTRNRSRLKGHVGLLRGFSPGGGRYSIQLTEA